MSLSNLSQVLLRNIDLLACQQALLVNFPVDGLYQEWLTEHPDTKIHYFTNNKATANELANISHNNVNHSFGSFFTEKLSIDLAIIAFPKSKAELAYSLAMIAPYLTANANVLFVGENKGGIKSAAKLSKDYVEHCNKIDSARHCSLYMANFIAGDYQFNIDDWYFIYPLSIAGVDLNIAALPGVFSQQGLDKGTKVLLEDLPSSFNGKLLDFGCGAGVISAVLAKKFSNVSVTGVDVSALATKSTEKTLALNGLDGDTINSDGLAEVTGKFDHIVSNPPFHQGLKTHYAATETFLAKAKGYLTNGGQLTVVANSFLKYQPIIAKQFKSAQTASNRNGFTVYIAR